MTDPAPRELTLQEARTIVLTSVEPGPGEQVPLEDASGAVLVADLFASTPSPPFDNSAMDGFAVRSVDVARPPVSLRVIDTAPAGAPSAAVVGPGEAVRILTGAQLPDGADSVVRVEDTTAAGDGSGRSTVGITVSTRPGDDVRRRGESISPGQRVIAGGTRLNAAHLATAATVGVDELTVHRSARVAVVSTGDELVQPGTGALPEGCIYDSNSVTVAALVSGMGHRVTRRHCPDDADHVRRTLIELAEDHAVVLTTGGVSMGAEYDVVRAAVAESAVEFWRLSIRPAKPMAFGRIGDAVYFGLPGNPVSAVVAFELFVRPALRRIAGITPAVVPTFSGVAGQPIDGGRPSVLHCVRVRRDEEGCWIPSGQQGSQAMVGLADSEALALLGPGVTEVGPGEQIELLPLWT